MAGGFAGDASAWKDYPGRMTPFVFLTCLLAATGGLSFGYNIGISGGLSSMYSFLHRFFPAAYVGKTKEAREETHMGYCKFESRQLTAFVSSLYVAALAASLLAATATRVAGRRWSMFAGGVAFLLGSILSGAAGSLAMLVAGRILLGVGIGFVNQSALLFLSEMAPARLRGMLNVGFQLMVTIGILAANLVNYGTGKIEGWGWRLSLALAAIPAAIMTAGSLLLPDTPSSLLHRRRPAEARAVLCRARGTPDVEEEYGDLAAAAAEASRLAGRPWADVFRRRHRPQLTVAIFVPLFQQLTGINVVMFYAPVLFRTIGLREEAALVSAVITGLANVFATFVCIFLVDRAGRRLLFLTGSVPMMVSLIVVGTLISRDANGGEGPTLPRAVFMVAFLCVYVVGFAWSWGPLGWLVPSEIFPLEIRSHGQSLNLAVNMLFTFLIAEAFLSMLCHMRFVIFYYFAGWVVVMTAFVFLLLPETKGVPIEQVALVWRRHWFWGRFVRYEELAATSVAKT